VKIKSRIKEKEEKMNNRFLGFAAGCFILAACLLAAAPARAQSVDQRIQALEQELSQLKEQQIELKKEATEAAAALPTFSYRPGDGMTIEAANKAWSFRASMETHMRMLFESGRSDVGRTNGEIMGRRFRPYFYYCVNNCLWEIEVGLDLDGFGTGNAKNSTNTATNSILQRGALHFHMENLNPWLPTYTVGMDISTTAAASTSRQGSSATGAQREYDILSRQVGPNTGRAGNGMTLTWDDRSLSGIGIPGRISRFQFGMANVSEGDDGLSSFTDRKDFTTYLGVDPFSQLKNKWIRGLRLEFGAWFCNNAGYEGNTDNGCDRIRLRDHGDAAAQTIFDTGSDSIGKGLFTYLSPGITWTVGPYRLRTMGGFVQAADDGGTRGKKRAHNFLIGHDLFVWSPKGFLTGSSNTAGSILVGYHFERNDASCELSGPAGPCNINGGQFHRETLILNEWDIAYFIMPRMSVLFNLLWYNASNLRVNNTGSSGACYNLGICSSGSGYRTGKGGDWVDGSITWRYQW